MRADPNCPTSVIVANPMNPPHRLQTLWNEGKRLSVEQFLESHPELELSEQGLLDLVIAEIHLRHQCGLSVESDHYIRRFPSIEDRLRDYFETFQTKTNQKIATNVLSGSQLPKIPGYEILHEVGRGGMGVVYKAIQTGLNRSVALKVILSGRFASAEDQERFRREATAIAALKHTAIVQVYQVGEINGFPFCALEFIEGGTLADLIQERPVPPKQAARLAQKIALGAHHAHENGIVHRDLKPANILLQPEGTDFQPKITDFGIAKRLLDDSNLTGTGMATGTPQYMAPEQALANKEIPVGPAADVYAIGVILHEMLTKEVPFTANNPIDLMKRVVNETPRRLSKISRNVPRDLETICLKCLEKEPHNRYPSALALAADLDRYLQGLPVKARRANPLEAGWRWCRRNPVVAGSLVSVFLVLTLSVLLTSYWALQALANAKRADAALLDQQEANRQAQLSAEEAHAQAEKAQAATLLANQQKQEIEEAKRQAEHEKKIAIEEANKALLAENDAKSKQNLLNEAKAKLESDIYQVRMNLAQNELANGQLLEVQKLLDLYSKPDSVDPRGFEWHYLNSHLCNSLYDIQADASIEGVVSSGDLVFLYNSSLVRAINMKFRGIGTIYSTAERSIRSVVISPDNKTLAISEFGRGFLSSRIVLYDLVGRRTRRIIPLNEIDANQSAKGLVFASDDLIFAAIGSEQPLPNVAGRIYGFDVETGKRLWALGQAYQISESKPATEPLMETKPIPSQPPEVIIKPRPAMPELELERSQSPRFHVPAGNLRELTPQFTGSVNAIAVVQGHWVVGGDDNGTIIAFDVKTGAVRRPSLDTTLIRGPITCFAASPNHSLFAAGSSDGRYVVWDLQTSRLKFSSTTEHRGLVRALAFSPKGDFLASGSSRGMIHIVETTSFKNVLKQPAHKNPILGLAYTQEKRQLISVGQGELPKVWTPFSNPFGGVVGYASDLSEVCSPQTGVCLVTAPNRIAGMYDMQQGEHGYEIRHPDEGHVNHLFAMNKSTGSIARISRKNTLLIFDFDRRTNQHRMPYAVGRLRPDVRCLEFVPSTNWIAIGYDNGSVQLLELGEGIDLRKSKVIESISGSVAKMSFSPDGTTAAFLVGNRLEIYSLNGKHLKTIPIPEFVPFQIRFSPDGKSIGICGHDRTKEQGMFREYRWESGEKTLEIEMHRKIARAFCYSPDGNRIVTGGDDSCVRLWDTKSGNLMLTLTDHPRFVDAVEFVDGGQTILSVGGGEIRRWEASISYVKDRHLQAIRSTQVTDIKTTFIEDNQVLLEAKLKNIGKRPIRLRESDTSYLIVSVCYDFNPPNGPKRFLRQALWGNSKIDTDMIIQPGESIPLRIILPEAKTRPEGPLRCQIELSWNDWVQIEDRYFRFETDPPRTAETQEPR
jgi:WD40 repeat protein